MKVQYEKRGLKKAVLECLVNQMKDINPNVIFNLTCFKKKVPKTSVHYSLVCFTLNLITRFNIFFSTDIMQLDNSIQYLLFN